MSQPVVGTGPTPQEDVAVGVGVRGVLRGSGVLPAAALSVLVGVLALVLTPVGSLVLRGMLWVVAGVALVARAGARHEPTWSMRLLGAANGAVGLSWLVQAVGDGAGAPQVADLGLLVVGIGGIGVATLVATPSWRHRAVLLDGVIFALAVAAATVAVTAWGAVGTTDGVDLAVVFAVAFATLLGPCVMIASLLTRDLHPEPGAAVPMLGLLALLHAGVATAVTAFTGATLPVAATVTWVVAPVAGLVMAAVPVPSHRPSRRTVRGRPTTGRLVVLVLVVLVPVAAGAATHTDLALGGLVVSLFAAIVLSARMAASASFEVLDARAAADVRFDALVEHAAEVLALLDDEGRLFYVSQAVQETFGVPPARVLGHSPAEIAHPEDAEVIEDMVGRAREQPGVPLHARLRLLDGDRVARHVDVTLVDLRHVDGVNAISLTVRDVSERVALEAELVRQARTDGLTGLVKRGVLTERVDHVLTARNASAALLFIDLDDFKLINDGYGHASGDEVLAVLAGRLQLELREHDTAGRMGGDEFAVLLEELSDAPISDALQVAERIAGACAAPVTIDGEPVEVQLSIGVALPEAGMTTAELFAAADAAMYGAKREKRGVVLYEPGMRAASRSRLRLMRDVRAAIAEGELDVSYQPIVSPSTRELLGVEALLRWVHPTLGNVGPDIILDHADAAGLTGELTRRIVQTIAADLATWREQVGRPLDVAVNLSAQQLVHVEPEEVLLQLAGSPDAAGMLTIEVTETSMLGDIAAAARVLDAFRDAGCHVAIDDFGTGYASIGYLRRLPLDKLKIDREFIDGLTAETADGSFAAVIQGLASALDLVTVAEGVETEEQLAAVRRLGCDMVQGFLFSRGLPMDELIVWVGAGPRPSLPVSGRG